MKKIIRYVLISITSITLLSISYFLLTRYDNSLAFELGIGLLIFAIIHPIFWPKVTKKQCKGGDDG